MHCGPWMPRVPSWHSLNLIGFLVTSSHVLKNELSSYSRTSKLMGEVDAGAFSGSRLFSTVAPGTFLFVVSVLWLAAGEAAAGVESPTRAETSAYTEEPVAPGPYAPPWREASHREVGARLVYLGFDSPAMWSCYDNSWAIMLESQMWFGRSGVRAETGFLIDKGTPTLEVSEWTVDSSELGLWVVPILADFLYALRSTPGEPSFVPYVGLGGGVFLGIEKLAANAKNDSDLGQRRG